MAAASVPPVQGPSSRGSAPPNAPPPAAAQSRPAPLDVNQGITASSPLIPNGTAHERPKEGEEPKATFAKAEHNFGIVEAWSTTPIDFPFKNEGKGPLRILQLRPGCGCVMSGVEVGGKPYMLGTPIPPNGEGIVRASIQALWNRGDKHTVVDVLTNDPSYPPTAEAPFGHLQLHLYAKIVRSIDFETEGGMPLPNGKVEFGAVSSNKSNKATVILHNTKETPFEIESVGPKDRDVEVTFAAANPEKTRWKIDLTLRTGATHGLLLREFDFKMKPEAPPTKLLVEARVGGEITIDPPSGLGVRIAASGSGVQAGTTKITLQNHSAQTLGVKNLRLCNPEDFKFIDGRYVSEPGKTPRPAAKIVSDYFVLVANEVEKGQKSVVEIKVKPTMPKGYYHVMLVFETGVDGGPAEVATPITVTRI